MQLCLLAGNLINWIEFIFFQKHKLQVVDGKLIPFIISIINVTNHTFHTSYILYPNRFSQSYPLYIEIGCNRASLRINMHPSSWQWSSAMARPSLARSYFHSFIHCFDLTFIEYDWLHHTLHDMYRWYHCIIHKLKAVSTLEPYTTGRRLA